MTVERRTSKHGLTHRNTATFTELLTEVDNELLARILQGESVEDWLARTEAVAGEVLEKAGLPSDLKGRKAAPGKIETVIAMVADRPHSEEWWAAHILLRCAGVRSLIRKKNMEIAVLAALHLGEFTRTAALKFSWERDAIRGRNVRAGASKGGKGRAQKYRADREDLRRRASEKRLRRPGMSTSSIAESIHKDLLHIGVKAPAIRTIRRHISEDS